MKSVRRIQISVIEAAPCGDDCKILCAVLASCSNAEAMAAVEPEYIDHVLSEHRDHRRKCQYGDCQWRQRAIINGGSQCVHAQLHGHFYHGVVIDREEEDEREDGTERIEYQSISDDLGQSELYS